MIGRAMTVAGLLALAAVAASFGGALFAAGDSLAVLRLPLALVAMVLLIATPRAVFWPALAVGAAAMLSVLWPKLNTMAPRPVTLYQKNLSFRLPDPALVAADILDRGPDLVTLQEVTEANKTVLDALAADYPARAWCPFAAVGGTAVASRWPPVSQPVCPPEGGLTALKVAAPFGPVWIVSMHLHWPWPHGQRAQIDALLPFLRGLDAPVILAGDFNMVPWGWAPQAIAEASGTVLSGPYTPTFWLRGRLPLPIDHVLAGGGSAEVLPRLGSDHAGVLAHVAAPPSR